MEALAALQAQATARLWQNEALFWLHAAIVIGGISMGLVLPFWVVLSIVVLHRLHLRIFDGCVVSKVQANTHGLADGESFLSQLFQRLFNVKLSKLGVKVTDYAIASLTLLVAYTAQYPLGKSIIMYFGVCLFAAWGVQAAWRMVQEQRTPSPGTCTVDGACGDVKASSYSRLLGVPIEYIGAGYFALVIAIELLTHYFPVTAWLGTPVALMSVAGIGLSLFFIVVQKQVLRQLCTLCMNVHAASLCMSGLIIFRFLVG